MADTFEEIARERRLIFKMLVATLAKTQRICSEMNASSTDQKPAYRQASPAIPPLLGIAEGLISAHRAALADENGYTLDLLEEVMHHVGRRLANELPRVSYETQETGFPTPGWKSNKKC